MLSIKVAAASSHALIVTSASGPDQSSYPGELNGRGQLNVGQAIEDNILFHLVRNHE